MGTSTTCVHRRLRCLAITLPHKSTQQIATQQLDLGLHVSKWRHAFWFQPWAEDIERQQLPGASFSKEDPKIDNMPENIMPSIVQKAIDACKVKNNEFAVLCHGDCWTSNMMFNYHDNGAVKNGILVDFQTCHWGPPTTDLNYFMFTSVANDTRINHQNELIQIYHEELKSALVKLDYEGYVPSLKELHIQLLQNKAYGVVTALSIMPLTIAKPHEQENVTPAILIGDTEEAQAMRKKCYSNPELKKRMTTLLPHFDQLGLLD